MEWALHIHSIDQLNSQAYPWRWTELYDPGTNQKSPPLPKYFEHIYLGDEFCPNRLPSKKALQKVLDYTQAESLSLTLVTPMVSDAVIEQCRPLFDTMSLYDRSLEIVINDWGLMSFVHQNYP